MSVSSSSFSVRTLSVLPNLKVSIIGIKHGCLGVGFGSCDRALQDLRSLAPTHLLAECDSHSFRRGVQDLRNIRTCTLGQRQAHLSHRNFSKWKYPVRGTDPHQLLRSLGPDFSESIVLSHAFSSPCRLCPPADRPARVTRRRLSTALLGHPVQALGLLAGVREVKSLQEVGSAREAWGKRCPAGFEVLYGEREIGMAEAILAAMDRAFAVQLSPNGSKLSCSPADICAGIQEYSDPPKDSVREDQKVHVALVCGVAHVDSVAEIISQKILDSRWLQRNRWRFPLLWTLLGDPEISETSKIKMKAEPPLLKLWTLPLSSLPLMVLLYIVVPLYFLAPWELVLAKKARNALERKT